MHRLPLKHVEKITGYGDLRESGLTPDLRAS